MPKKQPKNAFYFFMLDFRDIQREKGINYKNLGEVADAAGSEWPKAPPAIRKKYEDKAKSEKAKFSNPEMKYTSNGVPFSEVIRLENEKKMQEDAEVKEIQKIVSMAVSKNIRNQSFIVMDVNCFCKTTSKHVIGEFDLLHFNLSQGILNNYQEFINPPDGIPLGYHSDAKLACTELGLELPDSSKPASSYVAILEKIIDFMSADWEDGHNLPPIFTLPNKVGPINDFFKELATMAGYDETIFRVYKLNKLFFTLINEIKTNENEGFPKESLALIQLEKDSFRYNVGLGCDFHENSERVTECASSRTKRWTFTILDYCCPLVQVEMVPGKHVPKDFDMEILQTCQDRMRREQYFEDEDSSDELPNIAGLRIPREYGDNNRQAMSSGLGRGRVPRK